MRQVQLDKGDAFIAPQGVIHDVSTDTYYRLRRSDTLNFTGTQRKVHAVIGAVYLTWLPAEHPDLRQRITDWWLNKKEPTSG